MTKQAAGQGNPTVPGVGGVLDPRMSLALNVHTCPGVYAVLLGAGISMASGIKTGWGIVQDLVAKVAVLHDPDAPDAGAGPAADPESWWQEQFGEQLGYSRLLSEAAPTSAARQALLAGYFEPEDGDDVKQPTAAHRAIARLVKRGNVKVILTTNFDRLMERALEEVGISPQVVRDHQIDSMKPLVHSQVTIIKLHGDYADLEQRNTVDELEKYPDAQQELLERVLDEYGLIVCGWSADWDRALVRAVEGTRSRRYPMYWGQFGRMSEPARRLVAQHSAAVIDGVTADDLFTDLERRVEALDRMTAAPVTRDTAVAQLKRFLPDPIRRIEIHDLIEQSASLIANKASQDRYPLTGSVFAQSIHRYRADSDTLLHLLANGVFHDDGTYNALWQRVIERLGRLRHKNINGHTEELERLRHYPAVLAIFTMGTAAVLARREDFLHRLLIEPLWSPLFSNGRQVPAVYLNPRRVISGSINEVCSPGVGRTWFYPQSRWLREELREPFRLVEPNDDAYRAAFHRFEFLASLVTLDTEHALASPWSGEFFDDDVWGYDQNGLAADIEREINDSWPLVQAGAFSSDTERAKKALTALAEFRSKHHPW
ncbi:SIR2 family protein [Streptomyces sp. TRM68416]|uniref:SIR2 family protein n=1 Tax=Streptomyces sp. TRM68416 TaxID=2758412 RepID=UPI00166216F4|nr:SIR2 family protein [Streptomyces sp. TRM68416]MBD0844740.1 SIR2 family protein [Streptomyces sp. TRM68416]